MNPILSPSASVWSLNNRVFVLDPEQRVIVTQHEDGTPIHAQYDSVNYGALSGYIIDNGRLLYA